MLFRQLGSTDSNISLIGLGTMTWGEQNSAAEAFAQMDMAKDNEINFFDAAEMYPVPPRPETQGMTEQILGDWMQARGARDAVFLATKVTGRSDRNSGLGHIRDGARLSAEHIEQACNDSLRRLKTDYIDLYQIHWPERQTNFFGRLDYEHVEEDDVISIEETLNAVSSLVRSGKVRYIGISNETAWGMSAYLRAASASSECERIVSIQNPYNLLNRTFDVSMSEVSHRDHVSLLAYSPLAFGVLSGKYLDGKKPDKARLTLFDRFTRYTSERAQEVTRAYVNLANLNGVDPALMALAWINSRSHVASNIIGATTLEQLKANIDSVDLVLSTELREGIEHIHKKWPNPCP